MKKILSLILVILIFMVLVSNFVIATSTGVVTTETVRMRREANTSSDILELIEEGTEVEVLDEEDGWYKVKYDGLTGYISSKYIELASSSSSESGTTNTAVANENTNYEMPDDIKVITNETNNASNEVSAPVTTNNENTNTDNNIVNETPISSEKVTEFNLSKDAEIRIIPSFSSNKINTISKGTEVTVVDTLNNWIKITDGTNSGWVIEQQF